MTDLTKHQDWQEWLLDTIILQQDGAEALLKEIAPAIFAAGQASADVKLLLVTEHAGLINKLYFEGGLSSEELLQLNKVRMALDIDNYTKTYFYEKGVATGQANAQETLIVELENSAKRLTAATARIAELEAAQKSVFKVVGQSALKYEGEDSYSRGMDMGAVKQIMATMGALKTLFDSLPAPLKESDI